jgi:hypothetical protein
MRQAFPDLKAAKKEALSWRSESCPACSMGNDPVQSGCPGTAIQPCHDYGGLLPWILSPWILDTQSKKCSLPL